MNRALLARPLALCLLLAGSIASSAHADGHEDSWRDRISLFGDFRARVESRWFDDRGDDPTRLRYSARVAMRAELDPRLDVIVGAASGARGNDPFNTLGGDSAPVPMGVPNGSDGFDSDDIRLDIAQLLIHPFGDAESTPIPFLTGVEIHFGKMINPFQSPLGEDVLVWDPDTRPEGVVGSFHFKFAEWLDFTLDTGWLVLDQNFDADDPNIAAMQLDAMIHLTDKARWGITTSYYLFRDLDAQFFTDNESSLSEPAYFGNVPGLTPDDSLWLIDHRETLELDYIDGWPILLMIRFIHDLSAIDAPNLDQENTALSFAGQIGDPRVYFQAGLGYYKAEANSLPSVLIDSDLFDSHTNASGWMAFVRRRLFSNTELEVRYFRSKEIVKALRDAPTADQYKRHRLHVDLRVTF